MNRKCLIVGCGYVGLPLGAELVRQGHEVFGLRRSATDELRAAGIQPLCADITRPESLNQLPRQFDWVVNCAASAGGGAEDYRRLYLEGNRNLLAWLAGSPPKKYVFTSSTSVYGQTDGAVVTEKSPAEPMEETSKVLVETEDYLLTASSGSRGRSPRQKQRTPKLNAPCGPEPERQSPDRLVSRLASPHADPEIGAPVRRSFPAVILRVAGIYGPGRGHWFKQFLRGAARLEGDGARWLNMIHRDDVIGAIIAALERGTPGEIYNAADSEPVTQLKFFEWLAAELQRPLPPKMPADEPNWRKRGATNKRVNNAKLRAELKYEFKFPDFRTGYAAEIARLIA